MRELEHLYFHTQETFRKWLVENHQKSAGIWMIFYRKHVNTECIKYAEALEEALCFGWIDSIIKRIDDDQYVRKFTPRINISKWSELNKKMVSGLIQNGRMTEHGLKKIDVHLKTGKVDWGSADTRPKEIITPDFVIEEFAKNEPALSNFNNLPQTHRRHYVLWITNAKRDETIQKRIKEAVELLKQNRRLGLK